MSADSDRDPRLNERYVRRLPGATDIGGLTLVGVVHDHPASTYRVRRLVGATDHAILALELPPLAVPLFERYAEDSRTPPVFGGEMSAAIQASGAGRIVGIDGPSVRFVTHLARALARGDLAANTIRPLAGELATATRCAIVCRMAAALATRTTIRVEVDSPVAHAVDDRDDPVDQADDESRQIRQVKAVTSAFGTPRASAVRDRCREGHMIDRLDSLRRSGPVVAIVGLGHLDPIAASLETRPTS